MQVKVETQSREEKLAQEKDKLAAQLKTEESNLAQVTKQRSKFEKEMLKIQKDLDIEVKKITNVSQQKVNTENKLNQTQL